MRFKLGDQFSCHRFKKKKKKKTEKNTQTHRQKDRQTDRQTHTHTQTGTFVCLAYIRAKRTHTALSSSCSSPHLYQDPGLTRLPNNLHHSELIRFHFLQTTLHILLPHIPPSRRNDVLLPSPVSADPPKDRDRMHRLLSSRPPSVGTK